MDLGGQHRIPAPPGRVWQALNDEDVLRACIPGCDSLERDVGEAFRARVTTKIGAMKASFAGRVILSDLDPPNAYTISGHGEGGAAGFARGRARVELSPDGADATLLVWRAKAEIGGKLASIGSRLVQGVAAKTAEEFFNRFSAAVAQGGDMARPMMKSRDESQSQRPAAKGASAGSPPERHGPPERLVGNIQQVPPTPTIPYTLGLTPRQQNRVLAISVTCWLIMSGVLFFAG